MEVRSRRVPGAKDKNSNGDEIRDTISLGTESQVAGPPKPLEHCIQEKAARSQALPNAWETNTGPSTAQLGPHPQC